MTLINRVLLLEEIQVKSFSLKIKTKRFETCPSDSDFSFSNFALKSNIVYRLKLVNV